MVETRRSKQEHVTGTRRIWKADITVWCEYRPMVWNEVAQDMVKWRTTFFIKMMDLQDPYLM
jgi:hypothetical protein